MPSKRCWFCSVYLHFFFHFHLNSFIVIGLYSVQFSSVAQLCLTLCNPINHSTPGLIHHQLPEFTQTHVQSVMPSSHLILCCPLLLLPQSLPASGSFPMSQLFGWGGQSIGVSASASVLPMNTQNWSPLGWTGWFSLQSKGLASVFPSTTVQKHQFFSAQLCSQSNSHIHTRTTGKTIALTRWTFVGKVMSLLFNMLSRLVINFLPKLEISKVRFMHGWEFGWLYIRAQEENPRIDVDIYSFSKNKKKNLSLLIWKCLYSLIYKMCNYA